MTKYRNESRDNILDKELEELEREYRKENDPDSKPQEEVKEIDPPATNPEEETWKKRHGDLRRYQQQVENDFRKEIEELKNQLNEKQASKANMPQNKEEAEEWIREYPDLARVITTIITNETETVREDVRSARRDLEEERYQIQREQAWNRLLKVHPDFEQIKETNKFKEWLSSQPETRGPRIGKAIHDALAVNDTDAEAAISAVDLFKNDMKLANPRKDTSEREAARSITRTVSSTPPQDDGKRKFKESEIANMNSRTYDKLEEEIEDARLEGRIIYDLSGAAR